MLLPRPLPRLHLDHEPHPQAWRDPKLEILDIEQEYIRVKNADNGVEIVIDSFDTDIASIEDETDAEIEITVAATRGSFIGNILPASKRVARTMSRHPLVLAEETHRLVNVMSLLSLFSAEEIQYIVAGATNLDRTQATMTDYIAFANDVGRKAGLVAPNLVTSTVVDSDTISSQYPLYRPLNKGYTFIETWSELGHMVMSPVNVVVATTFKDLGSFINHGISAEILRTYNSTVEWNSRLRELKLLFA